MISLVSNQLELLRLMAAGAQLFESHRGWKPTWWLRIGGVAADPVRVLASTARAVVRKGYVAHRGAVYYTLATSGGAALERGKP